MNDYSPKKYHITTFGCQANVADSSTMAGTLESLGFEWVSDFREADLYIVNTCSVRQKSEDKVYGIGKEIKELNENSKKLPFILMAGCMVGSVTGERQRYAFEELKRRTPWVNEYINPHQLQKFPEILKVNNLIDSWAVNNLDFDNSNPKNLNDEPDHAFVNISLGCDNFCSFCVVPYSRGAEKSRKKEEIMLEIKHYILLGVKKITLCAQNVNSWGLDMSEKFEIRSGSDQKLPFASLLREVHEI